MGTAYDRRGRRCDEAKSQRCRCNHSDLSPVVRISVHPPPPSPPAHTHHAHIITPVCSGTTARTLHRLSRCSD